MTWIPPTLSCLLWCSILSVERDVRGQSQDERGEGQQARSGDRWVEGSFDDSLPEFDPAEHHASARRH